MQIPCKGNAFAILQEEKKILRRKEKKQKALLKKERHRTLSEVEEGKPLERTSAEAPRPSANIVMKWADVMDDEDDEQDLKPSSSLNRRYDYPNREKEIHSCADETEKEGHFDEEDLDDDEEEEDDDLENEDNNYIKTQSSLPMKKLTTTRLIMPAKRSTQVSRCEKQPINYHLLSKKERQRVHTQELEELDALLSQLAFNTPDKDPTGRPSAQKTPTSSEPELTTTQPAIQSSLSETTTTTTGYHTGNDSKKEITSTGTDKPLCTKSRSRKKKKNQGLATSADVPKEPSSVQPFMSNVAPKDALLAARKAAGSRKKQPNPTLNNHILESVIAEAKKKNEIKKSKQKKEKRFHEH